MRPSGTSVLLHVRQILAELRNWTVGSAVVDFASTFLRRAFSLAALLSREDNKYRHGPELVLLGNGASSTFCAQASAYSLTVLHGFPKHAVRPHECICCMLFCSVHSHTAGGSAIQRCTLYRLLAKRKFGPSLRIDLSCRSATWHYIASYTARASGANCGTRHSVFQRALEPSINTTTASSPANTANTWHTDELTSARQQFLSADGMCCSILQYCPVTGIHVLA